MSTDESGRRRIVSETAAAEAAGFDPHGIVDKWLPVWDRLRIFEARDDDSRERRYIVDMFPYPSGDLHMGHAEAFSIGDAVARYAMMQGHDGYGNMSTM